MFLRSTSKPVALIADLREVGSIAIPLILGPIRRLALALWLAPRLLALAVFALWRLALLLLWLRFLLWCATLERMLAVEFTTFL